MNDKQELKNLYDEDLKSALCLSCMECCKTIIIPTLYGVVSDIGTMELFKLRGIKVGYSGHFPILLVPSPCQHLGFSGCKIYNDRPDVCRNYDGRTIQLMKDACRWYEISELGCNFCNNIFLTINDLKDAKCNKCGSASLLYIKAT